MAGEDSMKLAAITLVCLLLAACIGHQQMQPDPNIGDRVYCYAVDDDEACFAEAKQLCPKGYLVDATETVWPKKYMDIHCYPVHRKKR